MNAERGQLLSHYRLVEKIGAGGMGVVWKADDTVLDRTVAIKVLPADLAFDEERQRMFLDEARLAASVSHARIVQVYEFCHEGDLDYIVMEYVEGQPLKNLLHGRPLSPDKVADWGFQLAEGLARAHRKGLIHRDLKPANILVTPEGEVKIVDFGLATLFSRPDAASGSWASTLTEVHAGEKAREIVGTLPYMSPEQVRGEKLDSRSDVFSFGAVLYEMTTGQRPFTGEGPAEIVQEILRSQAPPVYELVPTAPLELKRIIKKALAARPADRYQDTNDLAVDLKQLVRELESGSSPSYADLNSTRHSPRRPALRRAMLSGIGIATIVVLVWVVASRRGGETKAPSAPTNVVTLPERTAIAVLPFQNLSDAGPQAYFANGLHDELLTQLSQVSALKVISRTSVMGYQGTSMPPLKQIAAELGVGSVVEGSIQVSGARLRVNMQLIDAATDEHLWAEHYDRTLDDAFAIQSDVAQQIVAAVGAALTSAEKGRLATPPTTNAEAYRFYLQGCEYLNRDEGMQNKEFAQQLYERALKLDPTFALAHAMLSRVHGEMYWLRYDPSAARAVRQIEEAESALRLAPDLPQAHIAMGLVHYWSRRDYQRALDEFAIALETLPTGEAPFGYVAFVNRRLGNWNQVFAAFEKISQLRPRNADLFRDLGGQTYDFVGRYADAVRAFDRALSLAPDLHNAEIQRGWTYVRWQGQLDTLRAALSRASTDAEERYRGYVPSQRATLLLWERNSEGLLQLLRTRRVDVFDWWGGYLPGALYAAWAYQLRGEHAAAQAAFDSARVRLDSAVGGLPDDWRVHAARGLSLAGLGRRDDALGEARWLQQSIVYREDAFGGPGLAEDRARILAQAGDAEASLDEIERLLAGPSYLNVHMLRLDPRWDPIREHPRFKALLAKYDSRVAR